MYLQVLSSLLVRVAIAAVVAYVQHSYRVAQEKYGSDAAAKSVLDYLKVIDQLRRAESDAALLNLITLHEISIEYCPDKFLNNHEVFRSHLLLVFFFFDSALILVAVRFGWP